VYVPQNTPIDTASQNFVFGRVEGGVEAIAPKVVDETTGDGDGRWKGGDGDVNGTTSNVSVDSTRVKAALLATNSQQTRSSRITRRNDLPVSFWPPIQPADRPYGPARRRRRRGKLKIERINDKSISQTPKVETAHLWNAHGAQPPDILSKRRNMVFGPIRQRDRIKSEPTRVSQARNGETTHLVRAHAVQPLGFPPKRCHTVYRPRRRRGRLKVISTNVS